MHRIRTDTIKSMKDLYSSFGTYKAVARILELSDSDYPLVRHLVLGNHGKVSAAKERMVRERINELRIETGESLLPDIRENRIRVSLPRNYKEKLKKLNEYDDKLYTFRDVIDAGFACIYKSRIKNNG